MDRLPRELIDKITSNFERSSETLNALLTVSRKFQYASERHSGRFQEFKIESIKEIYKFVAIYAGYRIKYLRCIQFQPTLQPAAADNEDGDENEDNGNELHDGKSGEGEFDLEAFEEELDFDEDQPCRDTQADLLALNRAFSWQISSLFTAIKTLEDGRHSSLPDNVTLTILKRTIDMDIDDDDFCLHRYYSSWRIDLLPKYIHPLPFLSLIRILRFEHPLHLSYEPIYPAIWKLDFRIMIDIAEWLPGLEVLGCKVGGDEWEARGYIDEGIQHFAKKWAGPERDCWHSFATAVEEAHPLSNFSKKDLQELVKPNGDYV